MNMLQVLKSYKKFMNMEGEMKKLQSELQARIEPYKANMLRLQTEYKKPETLPDRREVIEREMRKIQMDASVVEEDAKKELMKRSGEAFTTVYRDVEDAVGRYAQMNGYELVMFYNDRIDHEKYHPSNVQQKLLQPASLMPIYVTPGMDITAAIIENLNRMYRRRRGAGRRTAGSSGRRRPAALTTFAPGPAGTGRGRSFGPRTCCGEPVATRIREGIEREKAWLPLSADHCPARRSARGGLLDRRGRAASVSTGRPGYRRRLSPGRSAPRLRCPGPGLPGYRHAPAYHAGPTAGPGYPGRTRPGCLGGPAHRQLPR